MKAVPIWARGGHSQTLFGYFLRQVPEESGARKVIIPLADGDSLFTKFFSGQSDTVIVLFHGLAGSISSSYMKRTARNLMRAGHSVLLVNHRGCGEGRALNFRKLYHSGSADDLSAVIDFTRKSLAPGKKMIAIGFSLSANALLLLLGREGAGSLPDAAISINPPLDLEAAAIKLGYGFNRVYDRNFLRQCVADIRERIRRGWLEEISGLSEARSLYEFDSLVTAPIAGFGTRENYYRSCSAGPVLHRIKIPTRVLTAKDDPFVDYSTLEKAALPPSLKAVITDKGGHLGYLSRGKKPLSFRFWMDEMILSWVEELRIELQTKL